LTEVAPSQRLTLLLDESPLKAIQRWLWVLSTGGTLVDGFVIFALGVAMPLIIAEFHIKPEVVGLIGAALVLGAVFGAGIGGPVADRLGRKRLMLSGPRRPPAGQRLQQSRRPVKSDSCADRFFVLFARGI